jgi:hypothetical protein
MLYFDGPSVGMMVPFFAACLLQLVHLLENRKSVHLMAHVYLGPSAVDQINRCLRRCHFYILSVDPVVPNLHFSFF